MQRVVFGLLGVGVLIVSTSFVVCSTRFFEASSSSMVPDDEATRMRPACLGAVGAP